MKKINVMIVMISWIMFFTLPMTGFSKVEDKKDENKTKQTESKKKAVEGNSLKKLAKGSKKDRKKGDKVFTNQDLNSSKGNISTSTISGKLKSDVKADSSEIDEEQKKSAEEIRISELKIEYFNKLVAQFFDIHDSQKQQTFSKKALNKVLNQFPAAVNNTEELKRLTKKKNMLLRDLDNYEKKIKRAREELEKLKVEIREKGLPYSLIRKVEARVKEAVYPDQSKSRDAINIVSGAEGY